MAQINSGASATVSLPAGSFIDIDGAAATGVAVLGPPGRDTYPIGPSDLRIGPFPADRTVYLTSQDGTILYSVGQPAGSPGAVVPISAADVSSPTRRMLADRSAVYQLSVSPFTQFRSDGSQLQPVGDKAGQASSGLRLGIIGASIEARGNPSWNVDPPTGYSRVGGVVTLVANRSIADHSWLPGHKIRVAADKRTDIEGTFEVLTSSVQAGVSTTITFLDPRPDVALGTVAANVNMSLHDLQCWTVTSGFQAFLNMALGGRLDIFTVATGSTNVVDAWGSERVDQLADQGPFDAVLIGAGPMGNAVKAGGYGADAAYQALVNLCELVKARINPRVVFVETLPLSRDVGPTSGVVTSAYRATRRVWRDLPRQLAYVRVVPGGEAMVQNYGAYNSAPSTDVANGYPEQSAYQDDGVHAAYPWARVRGFALGDAINREMARWVSPEMGCLVDTRQVNNAVDVDGKYNPNWALGLWGNVDATKATLSGTGISGVGPAGASASFDAGRGSSTLVGALQTNPQGGADWVVTITGAGSASGYTVSLNYAPAWLLAALQSAQVQGQQVDLFLPLSLQLNALKLLWVDVSLVATVGGFEYVVASAQANLGQYGMAASSRAMDNGYSGVFRFPRFKVSPATYTAAALRVRLKEVNGSVASGVTVVRWGPGQRFEVVEG